MRLFARFYRFYFRVCVNVYFSYLMRLKRKFNIKSGLSARFCIYTKKTPAQSLRECFTLQHNTYEKKHA